MKQQILTICTITLIALSPVAILSIHDASASKSAPGFSTSTALASIAASRTPSSGKSATKKKLAAVAKPASRSASNSKTRSARSNSSKLTAKEQPPQPSTEQRHAKAKVADLTTTQKTKMLNLLNEGDTRQLAMIKGISTTRASAIEKARPFRSIDEVVLVRGIGESTFGEVIAHARSLTARRSSSSAGKSKTSKS